MSKKKRKNRKARKHPVATGQAKKPRPKEPTAVVDVRADLRKTAILTAVCLIILFVLALTQSRWLP